MIETGGTPTGFRMDRHRMEAAPTRSYTVQRGDWLVIGKKNFSIGHNDANKLSLAT